MNDAEYLLMGLLAVHIPSSMMHLFKSFAHFYFLFLLFIFLFERVRMGGWGENPIADTEAGPDHMTLRS